MLSALPSCDYFVIKCAVSTVCNAYQLLTRDKGDAVLMQPASQLHSPFCNRCSCRSVRNSIWNTRVRCIASRDPDLRALRVTAARPSSSRCRAVEGPDSKQQIGAKQPHARCGLPSTPAAAGISSWPSNGHTQQGTLVTGDGNHHWPTQQRQTLPSYSL